MNGRPAALPATAGRLARAVWVVVGLAATGLGFLGALVPGLPSTVFFLVAAWCFSRSSPRLERWLLGLPGVGRMVRDYREGLGMRRPAKTAAVATMWLAIALSLLAVRDRPWLAAMIVALGAVGTVVIVWRVPTQERVVAARAAAAGLES